MSSTTMSSFQAYIQNNSGGNNYGSSAMNGSIPTNSTFFTSINGSAIISVTSGQQWALKYLVSSSGAATSGFGSYMMSVRIA